MIPAAAERDLRALCDLLPPSFAMVEAHETADGRRKGRCVEATRIVVAIMRRLGHQAGPLACDVIVANRAAVEMMARRVPLTKWRPGAWSVGAVCDITPSAPILQEPGRLKGFGGHLVVAGAGWFSDMTAEQYHRPDRGIVLSTAIMAPLTPKSTEIDLPRGGRLMYTWRPEVRSYRTVPAWRQDIDHDFETDMVARVRKARR